jgi:hypothetical protein
MPGHACAFNCQDDIVHLFLDLFDGGGHGAVCNRSTVGIGRASFGNLESLAK